MKRLNHEIFVHARDRILGETSETYDFLHWIGSQLPERFDAEDLCQVVKESMRVVADSPEHLPEIWMQQNPILVAKQFAKIREILGFFGYYEFLEKMEKEMK